MGNSAQALTVLRRMHSLGVSAPFLKQAMLENVVYHCKQNNQHEDFVKLIRDAPELACDLFEVAAFKLDPEWVPKDLLMPSSLRSWEFSISHPYPGLSNSFEALNDTDMTTGAGTHARHDAGGGWIQ